jgi:putative peptide zinc metalloprotease protein
MQGLPDISTVELTRTRLKLRDDLLFIPQRYGAETFYHVEVSTTSEFYRIGYPEYVFVSLLNGRTSFAEALAVTSQKLGAGSLNQFQAMTVYSWLLDNGLASFSDADAAASGAASSVRLAGSSERWWKKLNPLWIKVPLGRPEAFLKALQPAFGWLFSAPAFALSLILMISATIVLLNNWTRFSTDSASVIARENWVWLLAAWIGLKCVHETAHGLVCLRYGGNIRETGFVLAVLTPLAYVDASSCWAFRSRWHS